MEMSFPFGEDRRLVAAGDGAALQRELRLSLGASLPLVEVLLGGPSWREAVQALSGRFHCGTMSTEVTGPFTLALKPSFKGGG